MKRWWNTSRYPAPVRVTRRRVGRVLMQVVVAGAVSLPIPSHGAGDQVKLPRTGGAVIQAWAFGTLSDAKQPDTQEPCDLRNVCDLAISSTGGAGTGTGATIQTSFQSASQGQPPPNLPFTLTETIDYAHPVSKGHGANGHGACYPGSGVMSIAIDASSTLVLDMVGQACQVGPSTAQLVFTGSYVSDAASTGKVADADGIGAVNIVNPSGLFGTGTNMKISLVGQLKYGS
jgi:hypothetical protein